MLKQATSARARTGRDSSDLICSSWKLWGNQCMSAWPSTQCLHSVQWENRAAVRQHPCSAGVESTRNRNKPGFWIPSSGIVMILLTPAYLSYLIESRTWPGLKRKKENEKFTHWLGKGEVFPLSVCRTLSVKGCSRALSNGTTLITGDRNCLSKTKDSKLLQRSLQNFPPFFLFYIFAWFTTQMNPTHYLVTRAHHMA